MDLVLPALSAYLNYRQLQHPAVLDGATYDASKHLMTKYVHGVAFQNLPWVVAQFADGKSFAYYGDPPVLVGALRDGLVLDGLTALENVRKHVKNILGNVSGLTLTDGAVGDVHYVELSASAGSTLSVEASAATAGGVDKGTDISISDKSEGSPSTAGVSSCATLKVMGVGLGGSLTNLVAVTLSGTVTLIDVTSPPTATGATTVETFVASIVAAINSYTDVTGYYALASESTKDTVYVYAAASQGDTPNNAVLQATVSGAVCLSGCVFTLTAGAGNEISKLTDGSAVELLAATQSYATTVAAWIAAIVADVNSGTATHGYVAAALATPADSFGISKAVTRSDDAPITITATFTAGVVGGTGVVTPDTQTFSVSLGGNTTIQMQYDNEFAGPWQKNDIYVVAIGSVGTVYGEWVRTSPDAFHQFTGELFVYEWIPDSGYASPRFRLSPLHVDWETRYPCPACTFELRAWDSSEPYKQQLPAGTTITVTPIVVDNPTHLP